ncbi:Hint domain-containing protein [Marinovum sp. 2_MG-2023]|uniref:Hint domain-containing protein n=1 Tax=unclassified Marinovum TaxID=2647166 RepID=UPI0026E1FBCB|nr:MULTISPECIES: Hint domain-containing protein [unclassified Marinovum]MDO6729307.1 Hint domain-containing protein [Marinovum sp. 2_MG-2023]MDO6780478.1 Hint domain-containing protein [Marinovum sp. 1_MG-2023]
MARGLTQTLMVFQAEDLKVVDGANLGDVLHHAEELQHDDVYHLGDSATQQKLLVQQTGKRELQLADPSGLGTPGHMMHIDCCITFMGNDGDTVDLIVLVEVDELGLIAAIYGLPLGPLYSKTDYRVIGIDSDVPERRFAEVACVSFTRGTMITMASGAQKAVEDLATGDLVLTRDAGPQPLRWVGHSTLRATGEGAPIRIRAGTLHNAEDLLVSPDHRLFVYQRRDHLGAGRSEVMVKARHLINGDTVCRVEGGFVDYFQLLFDDHQIVYAEGIAAETLLVDPRTRAALPDVLEAELEQGLPQHDNRLRADFELSETIARTPNAVDLLRRASSR